MLFKRKSKSNEKYRFNFKKYPELLEKYEVYRKLALDATRWSMKTSNIAGKKMNNANKKCHQYSRSILAKEIYEIFSKVKPILYKEGNKIERIDWDEHFNKPFDEMNDDLRDDLVGLLDGDFVYELPEEYYNY